MKFLLFLFSLIVFNLTVFGQIAETPKISTDASEIDDIYLAKDDGNGKAGDSAASFTTTDIPIYCVVKLSSPNAALVKMVFVAVSVKGVKPESKVVSVSYQTDGKQDQVNFTGKPDKLWTAGTYRADILVNGKPAGNRTFEIEKTIGEIEKTTSPVIKKFVSPKAVPKPKPRRNR